MEKLSLENFINVFRDQFDDADQLNIDADTKFKQLEGWASLQSLIVITALDESFGYVFTVEEIMTADTIRQLFQIMLKRKDK